MTEPITDKNRLIEQLNDFAKLYGWKYTAHLLIDWVKLCLKTKIELEDKFEEKSHE